MWSVTRDNAGFGNAKEKKVRNEIAARAPGVKREATQGKETVSSRGNRGERNKPECYAEA